MTGLTRTRSGRVHSYRLHTVRVWHACLAFAVCWPELAECAPWALQPAGVPRHSAPGAWPCTSCRQSGVALKFIGLTQRAAECGITAGHCSLYSLVYHRWVVGVALHWCSYTVAWLSDGAYGTWIQLGPLTRCDQNRLVSCGWLAVTGGSDCPLQMTCRAAVSATVSLVLRASKPATTATTRIG